MTATPVASPRMAGTMDGSSLADAVVAAVSTVVTGPAALHEPTLGEDEARAVADAVRSGWVSTAGPMVEQFERLLAELTGAAHVVSTVNGTAALHLCLAAMGARPGTEVIVPSLTFVATANAVSYTGATPHFADCEDRRLGLDPGKLDRHLTDLAKPGEAGLINRFTGRPVVAVVCMHTFGHPADTDAIADVCARHQLPLIEDAAEAVGSLDRGRHVGRAGRIAALSFNGNKIVTTGGGGAVITDDETLARTVRHLATTGKRAHAWAFDHDCVAYNYRLPNLNAALGCAQLSRLERLVAAKRALAAAYGQAFAAVDGASILLEPEGARSNYWLNALLLDRPDMALRDAILKRSNAAGIGTRPLWTPMHRLPMYTGCPAMDLSCTDDLFGRIINLPSSAHLMDSQA